MFRVKFRVQGQFRVSSVLSRVSGEASTELKLVGLVRKTVSLHYIPTVDT